MVLPDFIPLSVLSDLPESMQACMPQDPGHEFVCRDSSEGWLNYFVSYQQTREQRWGSQSRTEFTALWRDPTHQKAFQSLFKRWHDRHALRIASAVPVPAGAVPEPELGEVAASHMAGAHNPPHTSGR